MRVFFARQALSDLREIRDFYQKENRVLAERVSTAIGRAIELIRQRPEIGIRSAPDERIRSKLLARYPYRIYYRVALGHLEIMHVRHTSRRAWSGETL